MFLCWALLLCVVAVSLDAQMLDENDPKAKELHECLYAILCKARTASEFREFMVVGNILEQGMGWMRAACPGIDPEDTPEYWESYVDTKCAFDEEKKERCFVNFMEKFVNYWMEVCKEEDSEECKAMSEAEKLWVEIQAKYIENGTCKKPGESTAEMGQEKMEEGVSKMGPGNPF